ncbi:hypothetical protein BDW74DRAFT_181990 [Aspergillus multicolor]|uniref:uncharacterized protein n=1 Tax=Aspergillus multicolor TaxID=41759 RepID=UPI003CCCFAD1
MHVSALLTITLAALATVATAIPTTLDTEVDIDTDTDSPLLEKRVACWDSCFKKRTPCPYGWGPSEDEVVTVMYLA